MNRLLCGYPILLLGLALVCALQTGCTRAAPPTPPGPQPAPQPSPRVDAGVVSATNGFGIALLKDLVGAKPRENVVISPASISLALAMVYNGSAGETRTGMAKAMRLGSLSAEDTNAGYKALSESLTLPEGEGQLYIANALWKQHGLPFKPVFLETVKANYGSEVSDANFHDPEPAAKEINDWASQQTRGRIPTIIGDPQALKDALMALLNAVYLKAEWADPFETRMTQEQDFTRADGSTLKIPMMAQGGHFSYHEGDGTQIVALPYKGRLGMYVVLPPKGADLGAFVSALTPEKWQQWLDAMQSQQGLVKLPRFITEYSATLNDVLAAEGMELAFDQTRADFSGIIDRDPYQPYISLVLHKTYLRVYEKGTEAAAVTAVIMAAGAAPPREKPFEMVVDRPFLCAIRDETTGVLLFLGAVTNPKPGTETE